MQTIRLRSLFAPLLAAVLLLSPSLLRAHDAAQQMMDAANWFLASLTAEQKSQATFPFDSDKREDWHFIPKDTRKGLCIRDMKPEQGILARALLNTGLSNRGQLKAATIMSLEEVLFQMESGEKPEKTDEIRQKRNPVKYFVSIFGKPSMSGVWGWGVEGHHLSINFTIRDGQLFRATPSFFGSNPGEVRQGPRAGLRVLGAEEDLGRKLVTSLNEEQWKKALVNVTAPKEMLTEAKRHVDPLKPEGISDAELTPAQKEDLDKVIHEFLFRIRPDIAKERWDQIKKEGSVHFAWAGEREKGKPHYYRVQGPTFLLEYDNTQNDANHIHTVWREFHGDFGQDLLAEHLKASH
jgi:hypothetical protein